MSQKKTETTEKMEKLEFQLKNTGCPALENTKTTYFKYFNEELLPQCICLYVKNVNELFRFGTKECKKKIKYAYHILKFSY